MYQILKDKDSTEQKQTHLTTHAPTSAGLQKHSRRRTFIQNAANSKVSSQMERYLFSSGQKARRSKRKQQQQQQLYAT